MTDTAWANLIVGVVAGVILLQALILIVKPSLWITWLVARPWKSFGVDVKIVDAPRLRRKARLLGIVQLLILAAGAFVYSSSCGLFPCHP